MKKKRVVSVGSPVSRRTFLKAGAAAAAGVALSPLIKISPVGAASEIPIGFVTGMTGFAGPWGRTTHQGYSQIVEEVNAAGGIKALGGAKLKLIVADSKSDLKLQASETEKMINVNKVRLALDAAGSALSMVSSSVYEKYGVVNLDGSTADPLTERGLQYYFRTCCKASDNGKTAVAFGWYMYKDLGKKFKKVAVIHSDDAWGTSAGKNEEAAVLTHPEWEFAGRIAYPAAKLIDATDYISRIKGLGVEVLIQSSTPETGIIVQQAVKAVDYNPLANIHGHGAPYKKEYVDALGKDAEYVYCCTQFVADMLNKYPKNAVDFCARYKKRYQGEDMDDNSATGCTNIATLIHAMETAKSADPDKVREVLLKTELWVGDSPYIIAGSGVKFDATHHNERATTFMHQMRDGLLRCVWPDKFKTRDPLWPVPQWKDRK